MSAEIVILPVIHKDAQPQTARDPWPSNSGMMVGFHVDLKSQDFDKLDRLAATHETSAEDMAAELIRRGIKAMEGKQ